MAIFPIIAMSLFQVFFDRYSPEQIEHKKKYTPIIVERNNTQTLLREQLLNGELSIIEFYEADKKNISDSKTNLQEFTKLNNKLNKEQSFLGRSNLKFWLYVFGITLLGLYFSVKSLIEDYSKLNKTGHQYVSIGGIAICLFWLYHLFFKTASNFYDSSFFALQFLIAICISFLIAKLFKHLLLKENKITKNFHRLFHWMYSIDEHIKPESKIEVLKSRVKVTQEIADNE